MKKIFYTRLDSTVHPMHNRNSKSQFLQPKQKKPCNIGSKTFSDGTPFMGPVLSPNLIQS